MSEQEKKSGSCLKAIGLVTLLVIIVQVIGTIVGTILALKMKYNASNIHDIDAGPPEETTEKEDYKATGKEPKAKKEKQEDKKQEDKKNQEKPQ